MRSIPCATPDPPPPTLAAHLTTIRTPTYPPAHACAPLPTFPPPFIPHSTAALQHTHTDPSRSNPLPPRSLTPHNLSVFGAPRAQPTQDCSSRVASAPNCPLPSTPPHTNPHGALPPNLFSPHPLPTTPFVFARDESSGMPSRPLHSRVLMPTCGASPPPPVKLSITHSCAILAPPCLPCACSRRWRQGRPQPLSLVPPHPCPLPRTQRPCRATALQPCMNALTSADTGARHTSTQARWGVWRGKQRAEGGPERRSGGNQGAPSKER